MLHFGRDRRCKISDDASRKVLSLDTADDGSFKSLDDSDEFKRDGVRSKSDWLDTIRSPEPLTESKATLSVAASRS